MSDDCRHWTTPRWLQTIYERFCTPFLAWVALASDGITPAALNLTADGKLKVDVGGGGSGSLVTLAGVNAGVTLPVSGDFYPLVQNVSLVGDSLSSIPVSLTSAASLAAGQSVGVSSLPAVSISGGSVTISNPTTGTPTLGAAVSIAGGQSLTSARSWNLATSTDSLTAAVSSLPAVSLAGSQTLTAALASGSTLTSSGNSTLASVASGVTLPVSGSFYPATQPVSGNLGRTWNLAQGTDTLYASLGSQTLAVTGNFYQATQPVSGTISLSSGSNIVGSVKITDGTLVSGVKSLGTQVTTSDNALITNSVIHGLTTGGGGGYVDVKVNPSGALTADVSNSASLGVSTLPANLGTTTLAPAYAQVTNAVSVQGGNSTAVKVDGSAVTQPVSGTFWQTTQPVSISTVTGGLGTSSLTPVYDSIVIPSAFKTGQAKVAVTGTAVQLGSNTLTQGVLISALSTNTASITIGTSSSVTNTIDGTGNGAILPAGSTKSIAATNTNLIWINGTAGDIISFIGS